MLDNAWEGYNSTLFAYGQTGSGKSWSMVGYGVNKGKYHCLIKQGSYRLEKCLNIQDCLEKSLKIKFALKTKYLKNTQRP